MQSFYSSRRTRILAAAIGVICFALVLWLIVVWSVRTASRDLQQSASHKLSLYSQVLDSEIRRHQFLPFALARNKLILELFDQQHSPEQRDRVNRYLADVSQRTRASAVYLMDDKGLTLASSNWDQPLSYVGNNYSFRPYFKAALAGGAGNYFAVGATTGTPGLFLSYPVEIDGRIAGVVAIKVALDPLEQAWAEQSSEKVLVSDGNGVIIASSEPNWKFHTLTELGAEQRQQLRQSRQFMDYDLPPLGLTPARWLLTIADAVSVATPPKEPISSPFKDLGLGASYLVQQVELPGSAWRMHIFADMTPVARWLVNALAIFGPTVLALSLLIFYLIEHRFYTLERQEFQRRTLEEQEVRISERTAALQSSNQQLQREILERQRAEEVLRATQNDLIQASKLAALGQLSAGLAHELNQPLAAIRTFSASGQLLLERGHPDQACANFGRIQKLTERMAKLTSQLKSFARKSSGKTEPVSLARAVQQSLELVEQLIALSEVEVVVQLPEDELQVLADQLRLEQVLINLFSNGVDAMKNSPQRRLQVTAIADRQTVWLSVADSGGGIDETVLPQIFDPFFTTKEVGEGLGLGLSISYGIVRDWGGTLKARNTADGAEFTIELPRCQATEETET